MAEFNPNDLSTLGTKKDLKPFNAVIQICPDCGKVDVYLNDGHECSRALQEYREENLNHG